MATPMNGFLTFATVIVALSAPTGQPPGELHRLEAFLAQSDTAEVFGEHCARHGGLGQSDAVGAAATNGFLREHVEAEHALERLRRAPDFWDGSNAFGTRALGVHRQEVAAFDGWRAGHGMTPTPAWDPGSAIPEAFSLPPMPGCLPRAPVYRPVPAPTWLTLGGGVARAPHYEYRALCEFRDTNELAKAVDAAFDGDVRAAIGGDMTMRELAPRDPLHFAWNAWLDSEVFARWSAACAKEARGTHAASAMAHERDASGPSNAALLAATALAAGAAGGMRARRR